MTGVLVERAVRVLRRITVDVEEPPLEEGTVGEILRIEQERVHNFAPDLRLNYVPQCSSLLGYRILMASLKKQLIVHKFLFHRIHSGKPILSSLFFLVTKELGIPRTIKL